MCLGLTGQVRAVLDPGTVLVRAGERELAVSLLALDEPVVAGDWVLVHAGYALARLSPEAAAEATALRAGDAGPGSRALHTAPADGAA